jgi:peptidoglycan/xylan/chitin deacetylase (PgdA/CDA1 family)
MHSFLSHTLPRATAVCSLAFVLALTGCGKAGSGKDKPAESNKAAAEVTPTPEPTPTPTPEPTPTPLVIDTTAQVISLCYHRFDDRPRDSLSLAPAEFEAQMQALKENGIEVISMDDFLAWRRGEKNIPPKAALIGIDDGYISGYTTAWPILQKLGYPFTMYIYTDYVKGGPRSGGQSMTWEQLAEMRDAGVDIGSHTISHTALNAKKGKTEEQYLEWLRQELAESKRMIEQQLGIQVKSLAYPYGLHNETVRKVAMDSGYEAAFTVYGQKLPHGADPATLGRYAIESAKPDVFKQALNFSGPTAPVGAARAHAAGGSDPAAVMPAAATMLTQPMEGETIGNPFPEIKANLATLGELDPKSVEMRISGFGVVPAAYDPATKAIHYQLRQRLRDKSYVVIVSGRAGGRRVEARWSFNFDPKAAATSTPPAAEEAIPAMKPAE